jgi:hypothetical protein
LTRKGALADDIGMKKLELEQSQGRRRRQSPASRRIAVEDVDSLQAGIV